MAGGFLEELTDPSAKAMRSRTVAQTALVLGVSSLVFVPTVGLRALLLCPVAWLIGHVDRANARTQGNRPDPSGELGRSIGKFVTLIGAAPVAIWGFVWWLHSWSFGI